ESVRDQLLMEDVQMCRVDRVFHGLKPVAVQLRQRAQPVPAVGACPDIIFWYRRRGLRPEISPVKPRKLLHRISPMLDGQSELAVGRFRRSLQTVTCDVIEPAVIRAGEASLFDSAVGK